MAEERQAFDDRPWTIEFLRGETTIALNESDVSKDFEELDELKYARKRIGKWNSNQLEELTKEILAHKGRERVRVLLVGHADGTKPSKSRGDYDTNQDYSQARIVQVQLEILRQLERADPERQTNVEWLQIPLSSEQEFLDQERPFRTRDREPRLVVEVDVLPSRELSRSEQNPPEGRPLELLDYIYFTFYTITTTGYGDIVPVSPFAKFITSVANLFEVVFIVIFFNVLVSFLRDGRTRSSAPGSTPPAESTG